jgi:excisionase family DNA binding protein
VGSSSSASRRRPSSRHAEPSAADVTELPPTISVEHAAKLLGVSRSAAYRAVAAGQLPNLRLGRRIYIPTARLLAMLGVSAEQRQ